jgi:CBS domain containing-hemolysin-like protein
MMTLLLTVCIALSVSFTCSLLEATLLSVSTTDIAKISEFKPGVAAVWKRFKDNIQRPIAVILIINTFAHTIGAAVSGSQFHELFGAKWVGLFSVAFSIFMIQFTEILPKTYGIKYNRFFAQLVAKPLDLMVKLFNPVVFLMQAINRPFEGKKKMSGQVDALNDIMILAHFASLQNMISKEQEKIVSRSIGLAKTKVEDIMVPRNEMKCLSTSMTLAQALVEAHISHHTRFPLADPDQGGEIIGYVNFKDIVSALQLNPKDPSLRGICRPNLSVISGENLTHLLNQLTKSYQHIAMVRDCAGKTIGLVTLEDIVECIIGDLSDEYDILPDYCYQIAENRYVVGGGATLSSLRKQVDASFPDQSQSVNDWITHERKAVPKPEDAVQLGHLTLLVRKVSRGNVHELVVEKN